MDGLTTTLLSIVLAKQFWLTYKLAKLEARLEKLCRLLGGDEP